MDWVTLHDRALGWMGDKVAAVGDDQWHLATPCTEWDVHALVHHNTHENLWAAELGAGRTIEEVGDRLDGDVMGDDAVAAYRQSAAEASEAFHRPDALEMPIAVSYGPIPGEAYLRHRVMDLVVHAWDLAKATGQDTAIEPELLDAAFTVADEEQEMLAASGVFATDVEAPQGADAQTRLLALTGRRP